MISLFQNLAYVIGARRVTQMLMLQFFSIAVAGFELLSVSAIAMFIAMLTDIDMISDHPFLLRLFNAFNFGSSEEFIYFTAFVVALVIAANSFFSVLLIWVLSRWGSKTGALVADSLYSSYIHRDWLFHGQQNSAYLIKQVSTECTRLTIYIILPILVLFSKLALLIFMLIGLVLVDPKLAIFGFIIMGSSYLFIYKIFKGRLRFNGKQFSDAVAGRIKLMNEGFGGIKEILVLGNQDYFSKRFQEESRRMALSQASNQVLSNSPKYIVELLAFSLIIFLIVYLTFNSGGGLVSALPKLAFYAIAGFKLLPSFQAVYQNLTIIQGNLSALESLRKDWPINDNILPKKKGMDEIPFEAALTFEKVSFNYPDSDRLALKEISLSIDAYSTVGIVGSSGSGKSTLLDIMLGLLEPDEGKILVGNHVIDETNISQWQDSIGYVPQHVFLVDGTIAENVALGVDIEAIDAEKLNRSIEMAQLSTFVDSLDDGVLSNVGESGAKLSGGQRQRIGIARALYKQSPILVFDEATSALDGVTEASVMAAIKSLSKEKTIILVAHRLTTIKDCDTIFVINDGILAGQGTYCELADHNEQFKALIKNIVRDEA